MAYCSQERKAELAPAIKAVMKKYGVKGSIAVRNHSTLCVNIKSGKIDFIGNYNATIAERDPTGNRRINEAKGHIDVNPYWYQEHFTGEAVEFIDEMITAMKGQGWFDKSDIQSDYFHIAYYLDINIGKWNKDYEVTE